MATSKHFTNKELACHHGLNGCTEGLVTALEELRAVVSAEMGKDTPILVHDAFRCQTCNTALANAATHSQHLAGLAADIAVEGLSAWRLARLALYVKAFATGGIGRSDNPAFMHVDVRGVIARWCYDRKGKVIPWKEGEPAAVGANGQASDGAILRLKSSELREGHTKARA